jgi:hypothetical protein
LLVSVSPVQYRWQRGLSPCFPALQLCENSRSVGTTSC